MKRIIIIIVCCVEIIISCSTPDIPSPKVLLFDSIFSETESIVVNGLPIRFKLPSDGVYTLTLIDKKNGQVISREKFNGKSGENIRKIYTNSIESQYLYLLLEDVTKNQIGKTTIITK